LIKWGDKFRAMQRITHSFFFKKKTTRYLIKQLMMTVDVNNGTKNTIWGSGPLKDKTVPSPIAFSNDMSESPLLSSYYISYI